MLQQPLKEVVWGKFFVVVFVVGIVVCEGADHRTHLAVHLWIMMFSEFMPMLGNGAQTGFVYARSGLVLPCIQLHWLFFFSLSVKKMINYNITA